MSLYYNNNWNDWKIDYDEHRPQVMINDLEKDILKIIKQLNSNCGGVNG